MSGEAQMHTSSIPYHLSDGNVTWVMMETFLLAGLLSAPCYKLPEAYAPSLLAHLKLPLRDLFHCWSITFFLVSPSYSLPHPLHSYHFFSHLSLDPSFSISEKEGEEECTNSESWLNCSWLPSCLCKASRRNSEELKQKQRDKGWKLQERELLLLAKGKNGCKRPHFLQPTYLRYSDCNLFPPEPLL